MKFVKRLVVLIVALVLIVVAVVIFRGGAVIRQGVNRVGPQVLGVPVVLEGARFSPFQGLVQMSRLTVGNPEGFRTDHMFFMDDLEVEVEVRSLLSDTIVINRIHIEAPQIIYEAGLRGTNLGTLLARLESEKDPAAGEGEGSGKTVVIRELTIANASAQVSATALQGREVTIEIPPITLTDLGGEDQDTAQIVAEVVRTVIIIVINTVADEDEQLGAELKDAFEEVDALRGVTEERVRAVTDAVRDGARAVRGLFGGDRDE